MHLAVFETKRELRAVAVARLQYSCGGYSGVYEFRISGCFRMENMPKWFVGRCESGLEVILRILSTTGLVESGGCPCGG